MKEKTHNQETVFCMKSIHRQDDEKNERRIGKAGWWLFFSYIINILTWHAADDYSQDDVCFVQIPEQGKIKS